MSLVPDMRTYLLTQSGVTDVLSNRIYYDALRQATALPACVLELTRTEVMDRHLSATGAAYRSEVMAYAYADSRPACDGLRDALHTAIEFASGTWGSTTVERSFVEYSVNMAEEPNDASGAWRYVSGLFTAIWHD